MCANGLFKQTKALKHYKAVVKFNLLAEMLPTGFTPLDAAQTLRSEYAR